MVEQQLKIKDAELLVKSKMLAETQLTLSREIKSYKERLKNVMLEYDNYKNSHPEKHTGAAEIMKVDDKCELTSCMNQMKAEHEEFVTLLILERQKNLRTRKQQYEETIDMLKNKHDEVLGTLKDMEESKKKDIPKIETKNGRIENLAKYNNQACTGIQNQFGDINGNNWSRIATLESYKERLKNVMLEYDNYKNSHPEKHTGAAEIMKVDDKCELTSCMNQMKAEHEEFVTLLILERQKNLRTMKQQYEERIDMLNNKHDEVLGTLKDMEESKKKDIPKIETKNGRIENLAKYHNQACTGIQNQFGDINGNNWSRIATLELNEELTGMSDEIGQLEITASQSGPHTLMSQGTSGTAPPTHDAKGGSMP